MSQRLRLNLRRFVSGLVGGTYRSSQSGGGGYEVKELKEFKAGDDLSALHPLTSIKRGKLFLVLREPERAARILFLMDLSRSGKFGSSSVSVLELQTSLLSILAQAAAEGTNQIGLLAFTSRIENFWKPYIGLGKILARIKRAAGFTDLAGGTDLKIAVDFVSSLKTRPDLVIIASDFLADENYEKSLWRLKSKSDVICLLLADPKEKELKAPRFGYISVKDLESGTFKNVQSIGSGPWPGEKTLHNLGLDYEIFSTNDSPEDQFGKLCQLFERRRIAGVKLR